MLNVGVEEIVAPAHLDWHATLNAPTRPDVGVLIGDLDRYARAAAWRKDEDVANEW